MRMSPLKPLYASLALISLMACTTTKVEQEQDERRRLSVEMFRELIEQGTLTPTNSMGDSFEMLEDEIGEDAYLEEVLRTYRERKEEITAGAVPDIGETGEEEPIAIEVKEVDSAPLEELNPYAEFGSRILVHEDASGEPNGLITKPYSVRPGTGVKVIWLLNNYGGFALWDPEGGPQVPGTLRAELQEGFELEQLSNNLRSAGPDQSTSVEIADWVIATGDRETLGDFEYFLDVMFAGVPQIEIEAKIVEYVLSEAVDIGVGPVDGTTPIVGLPESGLFDSFNWSFPNQTGGPEFLTSLRAVHDGTAYSFLLEMMASYENIEITSRPKVAVREGTRAMIESTQKLPFYKIGSITNSGGVSASLDFQEVGVRLYAIPRLIGGNTISLEIDVEASQQVGNEVGFITNTGEAITTPTLGIRKAHTMVYLKPGQAVILGGLITERVVEDEKKIPYLGDVPILGALFRSRYERKELVSVLFFIRPRILEGVDLHRDF
jgi:hypothetical protein